MPRFHLLKSHLINLVSRVLLILLVPLSAQAFETMGRTYAIAEKDLLLVLQEKARDSDALKSVQKKQAQAAKQYVSAPPINNALPRAEKARVFAFDPTFVLQHPLTDHKGHVLYPVGYTANPLDIIRLRETLLFINGSDEEQVAWAERLFQKEETYKVILTGGSPQALSTQWQRPVFFDQRARLTTHFGIQAVPAFVYQQGRKLTIEEVAL